MNQSLSQVQRAHQWVSNYLHTGDTVIDATVGNGLDTCFLAQLVGADGHVYGFDIQQSALDRCYKRLQKQNLQSRVSLINSCHTAIGHYTLPSSIDAIMFNLGYLPGGDKKITTEYSRTLKALDTCLYLISKNGVISIIAYPGHPAGLQETSAVKEWAIALSQHEYRINIEIPTHALTPAPELITIIKL